MRAIVLAALVACFAAVNLAMTFGHHEHWSGDGYWYAQTMLRDLGYSPQRAHRTAQAFYLHQPIAQDRRYRWYFADNDPAYVRRKQGIFSGRPLFPFLSSLLFRRYGFAAPLHISGASYIAAAVVLFLLLAQVAPGWIAALGACALPLLHTARWLGTFDLTDMFALFLWIVTLAALQASLRGSRLWVLALLGAGSVALELTRPAIYLPAGAALGLAVWAASRRDLVRAHAWRPVGVIAGCVVVSAILAALMHAPGVAAELRYDYVQHFMFTPHPPPFAVWYPLAVRHEIGTLLRDHVLLLGTLLPLAVAAVGMFLRRDQPMVAASAGVAVAVAATILVNPMPGALTRTFVLPLYPIVILGAIFAACEALDRSQAYLKGRLATTAVAPLASAPTDETSGSR